MAHRRLSSAEKGKGLDFEHQEPARATRVKVPLPDNSDLLRKHSLTLIGRVTNKTAQKCLVARAEEKAKKAAQEKADEAAGSTVCKEKEPNRDSQFHPANMQRNEGFRFSATNRETSQSRGYTKEGRDYAHHRKPKYQSKIWHERSSLRQSSQARERAKFKNMRFTRTSREHSNFRQIPEPQTRSYYREVSRRTPENIETVSSASKIHQEASDRGNPLQTTPAYIPDEVLNEARAELRDYMIQYTKSADPTEREARKERFRKAEEQGEMEEAAIQMAKTSMSISADRKRRALDEATPERVPATQRLGSSSQQKSVSREENSHELMLNSQERLPVSLRVGPAIPQNTNQEETETFHDTNSSERIPATQRLGPPLASPTDRTKDPEAAIPKRKPGRPPGRKAQEKILQEHGAVQKRRTVAQKKNSPGRRKTSPKTTAPARLKAIRMAKEWTNAQEHLVKSQKKIPSCTPIPLNCSLMRSDAAWRVASQLAGLGWTIRREGEEVASFSSDSSVNSALVAEAMAMRQAVKESWILGHKRMRCEADSDQLIKALNGNE
ncbi:hypothetical protein IGI04_041683, partial [Brassica rapa subsp. trilocularis]